ncbi:MAG: rhodanese-like domain-containing protein [Coxiellaceae bacterium]|nr:MAG: rhodanese-like domain-containing protein [Coxiellaceae bacterium]
MKTITATELKSRLDNANVLLIDVREPAEYRSENIEGAYLIPLSQISHEKLPSKNKTIVIHCGSGRRSVEACKKLLAQDPTLDVYSLEGGIKAWEAAGFNVRKSESKILPLDRQTQVVAGFLVLCGIILGTLVHPAFYIISSFVGLGLMYAGISGWCGMAKLLAKMPWNK